MLADNTDLVNEKKEKKKKSKIVITQFIVDSCN